MNWYRNLPQNAVDAIKSEARGEAIQWAACPDPKVAFWSGFQSWLMGIPWTALTGTLFVALVAALFSGKPPLSQVSSFQLLIMAAALIFTGAFVAIGLAMLATPFWAGRQARRTVYAITDKRVLTIVLGKNTAKKVTSFDVKNAVKTERRERRDGSGTLKIILGYSKDSDGDHVERAEELLAIPDASTAERLIQKLRNVQE